MAISRFPSLFLLILIIGLATFSRTIDLESVPPGFFVDESAIGVNAYFISKAGIDQYGRTFPIFFRALDDYKNALYIYTTALFLKFLDLNEFSARLPAALFGVIGIVISFHLGKVFFDSFIAGVWMALLVLTSPLHFQYSRIAWQAITLTVVYPLAVLLTLHWFQKNSKQLACWAGICFALSLYTYTTAKLLVFVTVVVIMGCAFICKKEKTSLGFFCLSLFLVSLPYVISYLQLYQSINLRFYELSLPLQDIPRAYFSYFHPKFLFLHGDANLRHGAHRGILNWYMAPLCLLGLPLILKAYKKQGIALLLLLLFIPILGSLSQDYPHTTRILIWTPFIHLLGTAGILFLIQFLSRKHQIFFSVIIALFILSTGVEYLNHYFKTYAVESRVAWRDGFLQALRVAQQKRRQGEVVKSPSGGYIDWMFLTPPSPELIKKNASKLNINQHIYDPRDVLHKYDFIPYQFAQIITLNSLYVLPKRILKQLENHQKDILYENRNYVVFRFYQ